MANPTPSVEPERFVTLDSGERQEFGTGAKRDSQEGKPRFDLVPTFALQRVADLYARGAEKYDDNNWMKGIPATRCLASLERHLHQFKQGDVDEDHLAAVVWNALAIMHYQEVGPLHDPEGNPILDLPVFNSETKVGLVPNE